ncbi:MAG: hypothetical protein J4478_05005 [Candidatus Diapherotrites archaeon]|uniref:Uncharacterized protein n=1 Tax=Candidatus Iainarchaeum sp. TaxID=3101447 RepID=A0A7J4KT97_9ARCH|nr:hypothetical protein [Candidatus Diapherotrites archaeon]HIH21747.1 hypothetical protein [Candidatus Diapherotrites archaeon]HIH33122.1 hypothetical protein [Candidatus Diapherotrites archaeon]
MAATKKVFLTSAFMFIVGVLLATLFFWSIIEGISLQLQNNRLAFVFYFLAFLSGVAAVYNYLQAKSLFHYAKLG